MISLFNNKEQELMVPTSISEINTDYIKEILRNVNPGEYYTVIALVYSENLFGLVSGMSKGNATASVTPIIAKTNNERYKIGQVPIIDRSSIERGVHLYVNDNVLAPSYIYKFIMGDEELKKAILNGTYFSVDGKPRIGKANSPVCYFVEFKVIANNDIVGSIDLQSTTNFTAMSYYLKQTIATAN